MKLVHIQEEVKAEKKLPMDKDPKFLAALRKQIIADHNRKIRETINSSESIFQHS